MLQRFYKWANTDVLLIIVLIIHLATREWPWGGYFQTVMDVLLFAAIVLTAAKYLAKKEDREQE